jgi:hypothetical protein
VVSIDDAPVLGPSAQFGGWLEDGSDRLIAQSYGPHAPMLVAYPGGEVLAERGANEIRSGGGVWAAWLAGVGLFSSIDFGGPDKYLQDVGPDGAIAYTPHTGFPIKVHPKHAPLDGSEDWTLSETSATFVRLMGGGAYILYRNSPQQSSVLVVGLILPVGLPQKFYGFCMTDDGAWCAYQDEVGGGRVVVRRPGDPSKGYVIPAPIAEGLDVASIGDDARVGFYLTKGEQPGELVIKNFSVRTPMQPLDVVPPPLEPTPMYEPIPSEIDVVRDVWNRATPDQRREHAWIANAVAWELQEQGQDFYVNQKRGTEGDSEDAISTPHPEGAGGWAIVDVVANFGGSNPQPAWIDQTQATINGGTVGGGRLPTNPGSSTPPPDPSPNQPPSGGNLEARIAALERDALRNGSRIALRTDNGHVICADGGGGHNVHSDRTQVGSWETFTVEKQ